MVIKYYSRRFVESVGVFYIYCPFVVTASVGVEGEVKIAVPCGNDASSLNLAVYYEAMISNQDLHEQSLVTQQSI